ncbi:MAG: hypothetical protein VW338_00890 [Rhodospirillaceae bacterium]
MTRLAGGDLGATKNKYRDRLRAAAADARARCVTPGKEMTYLAKRTELEAFRRGAAAGPYLAAEAIRRGVTARQAAEVIEAAVQVSDRALATIDGIELGGLAAIDAAGSAPEIAAAFNNAAAALREERR